MTNKKNTKRALLSSLLSLLLCMAMLIGTTYAWFTDSVTSANNIIKSGNLDVEMFWAEGKEDPAAATWQDASAGAIFDYDLWEPGYTSARHIKIENKGTLALKYQFQIIANGEVSDLADVIDVYYVDPAEQIANRAELTDSMKIGTLSDVLDGLQKTGGGSLVAGAADVVTIALKMQESAGNEYQNKSIGTDFTIQLLATQLTSEEDSFDHLYDKEASWLGKTDVSWYNTTDTEFVLTTAEEFAGFAAIVNGEAEGIAIDSFKNKTVKLGKDIYLNNVEWTPIGSVMADDYVGFQGTFDGQEHTVYDLFIDESGVWAQGLFGYFQDKGAVVKNLNVKNAKVTGEDTSGVIAGYATFGTFENLHVSGKVEVTGAAHMGGVVGHGGYSNFSNCSVVAQEGSKITATTGSFVGGIVGYQREGALVVEDCVVKNLDITGNSFVGAIKGIVSFGNTITGCEVENVTVTMTRVDAGPTVGLAAGCWDGDKNTVISNNSFKNVTLNGKGTSAHNQLVGATYSGVVATFNGTVENNTYDNVQVNVVVNN